MAIRRRCRSWSTKRRWPKKLNGGRSSGVGHGKLRGRRRLSQTRVMWPPSLPLTTQIYQFHTQRIQPSRRPLQNQRLSTSFQPPPDLTKIVRLGIDARLRDKLPNQRLVLCCIGHRWVVRHRLGTPPIPLERVLPRQRLTTRFSSLGSTRRDQLRCQLSSQTVKRGEARMWSSFC